VPRPSPPDEAGRGRATGGTARGGLRGRLLRYAGGSGVAAVCSEVAFLLLYGPLGASPGLASVVGWLAGAVPNYWLNRSWTWRRRGRPSLRREVLPYAAIILATVALAVAATSAVHALTEGVVTGTWRVVLVNGTFLAVYALVFVLRYVLLDRLFRGLEASPGPTPHEEEAAPSASSPPATSPPATSPPAPAPARSAPPPDAASRTPRGSTSSATAPTSSS
jgi:putative flippase GtrA